MRSWRCGSNHALCTILLREAESPQLCAQDMGFTALHRVRAMGKGDKQQHGDQRAGQVGDFTLEGNHEA